MTLDYSDAFFFSCHKRKKEKDGRIRDRPLIVVVFSPL